MSVEETSALCKKKKSPHNKHVVQRQQRLQQQHNNQKQQQEAKSQRQQQQEQTLQKGLHIQRQKNAKPCLADYPYDRSRNVGCQARPVHMIVMIRPSMRTKMNTACMLFWAPLQMRDVGGLSPEPHQA